MSGEAGFAPLSRPLRIGLPQPWLGKAPMSSEVAEAFSAATSLLAGMGHDLVEVDLPGVEPDHHIGWAIAREVVEVHRGFRAEGRPYGDDVAARLDAAEEVTDSEAEQGRAWQGRIRSVFSDVFEDVDILMTPTVPVREKRMGIDEIGGLHYRAVISYFAAIVNHALLPAVAMPLLGTGSPPLSLQAIGPMNSEDLLLGFAAELESAGVVGFTAARSNPQTPQHR
jgi:aspartyl-tRNA(Asn)/glutamyl-tRNA(Gln) amidotransferase subunit A